MVSWARRRLSTSLPSIMLAMMNAMITKRLPMTRKCKHNHNLITVYSDKQLFTDQRKIRHRTVKLNKMAYTNSRVYIYIYPDEQER